MLRLYNSLTKRKEDFVPLKAGEVSIYSCGPTVYDHAHIGNLRAYITADLLVRVLADDGLKVRWVMNLTDIDDKIIDRLRRDYPDDEPEVARAKLSQRFTELFFTDLNKINVDRDGIEFTAATDYVEQMQRLIRHLVEADLAYVSEGSVYFNLKNYQEHGHKYGLLVNVDFAAEARVTNDQDQKEGAADFALWKAKKPGEPSWDFELGSQNLPGRPGWHIECTAMSTDRLGHEFDIHTGGVDLKFPHHENEIAQNEGTLARFFVHNEHLHVAGQKMAKSAGNFLTLEDIDDPMAFRFLVMQAHYRSQMNFTEDALRAAENRLQALREIASKSLYNATEPTTNEERARAQATKAAFHAALEDDLNTPRVLEVIADFVSDPANLNVWYNGLKNIGRIIGLDFVEAEKPFTEAEKALMTERDEARKTKDFAASDQLRDQLKSDHGIDSEDLAGRSLYWRIPT